MLWTRPEYAEYVRRFQPPVETPTKSKKPPVKKQSAPAPSPLRKPAIKRGKRKKPEKRKGAAPAIKRGKRKKPEKRKGAATQTSATPKLKPGKKQFAIWDEIILPHLDDIAAKRPFASLGRARDAAKERLRGCEKGLSDSALERGIKRNRPHWFEQA